MNPSHDSLSEALRGWQVNPPRDPNFRERVWNRIGRQAGVTWPNYLRSHLAAWSMAAAIVVGVAGFTGGALARSQARADRESIVVTYLVGLDPRLQALLKP